MRIERIKAFGGTIDRVLDDLDHKVAEFYRPGDAEKFLAMDDLIEVAILYADQKGACEGIEDEPCLYCMAEAALTKSEHQKWRADKMPC